MFSFIPAFNLHVASTHALERLNATLTFIYNLMTSKGKDEKPPDDTDVTDDVSGVPNAVLLFAAKSSSAMQSLQVCFLLLDQLNDVLIL